jgi:hypothetical protein
MCIRDRYESDLQQNVEEPAAAADAEPTLDPGASDEEDIANIELQEVLGLLDINDIIENLL